MRVDAAALPAVDDQDPLTRLKSYLSALRRRWYLIVVLSLLGAAAGWATAPEAASVDEATGQVVAGPTYYRASHILIQNQQAATEGQQTSGVPTTNLSQAAYLVNTGEVPVRVAEELGLEVDDVEQSLLGLPRNQVNSVEVQAVGVDEDETVALADAAASELVTILDAQAKADVSARRDQIIEQLDQLNTQIDELTATLAADPPNRTQIEAQQRSVTNQYSLVYEQFSQLANQPEATSGLSSLEGAKALEISESSYRDTLETIRDGADYVTGESTTVDATTSTAPAPPAQGAGRTTRTVAGLLIGLLAGVGAALSLDRFDNRLRRRSDVELASGLPVIAELPVLSRVEQQGLEVVAHTQHRSRVAEAYRVIRGAVLFAETAEAGRAGPAPARDDALVLMVTSSNPSEGKTTVTANLAAVLAEGGLDVLVLNCDFRRPRVHKYLHPVDGTDPLPGNPPGPVVLSNTQVEGVRLITGVGEDDPDANPLDVIGMQRKIVQTAKSRFDVILLDTAPFLTTNDASELLSETDHVIYVVRAGKTRRDAVRRTSEILDRLDAPVLGVVFNASAEASGAQYYYYGYDSDRSRKTPWASGGRDESTPTAQARTGSSNR